MKVLFFTYDFPYPTNSGGKNRAYHLLKYGAENTSLYLFSFTRDSFKEKHREKMKEVGIEAMQTFPRRKVKSLKNITALTSSASLFRTLYYEHYIADTLFETVQREKIDVIHYESFYTACYASEKYQKLGVRQIFGTENIEYKLYQDYARYNAPALFKPFYLLESRKMKKEEERYYRIADMNLAVTESEASYIRETSGSPCEVIENGVDLDVFTYRPKPAGKKTTILFVGNFSYFPNVDAVYFFYYEVLKKLDDPDVRFTIVGKGSRQFSRFQDPRVTVHEYVEDIRDVYYEADVFISPIKIGGGTNFKILEAMACGVPVIAFTERIKEFGAVDEKDVLTADDGVSFLRQVERLTGDQKLRLHLAKNARKIVENNYSWEVIGKKMNKIWKSANS